MTVSETSPKHLLCPSICSCSNDAHECAVLRAIASERDACAKIADAHHGTAAKKRQNRRNLLKSLPPDIILAEERGENIASNLIASAIRARRQ